MRLGDVRRHLNVAPRRLSMSCVVALVVRRGFQRGYAMHMCHAASCVGDRPTNRCRPIGTARRIFVLDTRFYHSQRVIQIIVYWGLPVRGADQHQDYSCPRAHSGALGLPYCISTSCSSSWKSQPQENAYVPHRVQGRFILGKGGGRATTTGVAWRGQKVSGCSST